MNILILNGSPRRGGNTAQVIDLVREELESAAQGHNTTLDTQIIELSRRDLGFCRGCRICFDRGEDRCPLKDDLLEIKAALRAADGLLIASPVYVDDVSGVTKNWIDRMAHVCHRPEFAGKAAFLLATSGGSPFGHTLRTLSMALSTWGFYIAGQAGFKTGALMKPSEMRSRYGAKTQAAARQFFSALYHHKPSRPTFLSLMMFKIQQTSWQRAETGTYDYNYWQRQGWLDRRCQYYIPHNTSPVTVALARLTGAALAPFVL